jgi:dTDP-D-glucose 4,6-dehydratase
MQVEDRPGHDRRYAMDGAKLAALGWQPRTTFEDGLAETIDWYRANEAWWRAARSGDWDGWYARQYGQRRPYARASPAKVTVGLGAPVSWAARSKRSSPPSPTRRSPARPARRAPDASISTRPMASGRVSTVTSSEVVVHAAARTDVDGCALDPDLAIRRNGHATGVLAAACAERGTDS